MEPIAAPNPFERPDLEYPSFNVLLFYFSDRRAYRPTIFSTREVFCSPDCQTQMEGDRLRCLQTPTGIYDVKWVLDRLPASQHPELAIVKADASKRSLPTNLHQLNCPTLFISGDTHHLHAPIRTLLEYAAQEQFDFVTSEHDRHHLHYFKEAGFENVFWLPGFSTYPHWQTPRTNYRYSLSFVGQVGSFHPYRTYVLDRIKAWGFPLNQLRTSQDKASAIYADSQVNLNISLNGDLNFRIFEAISSGGFLLTDKLSPQSGLELLFRDGEHFATFANDLELRDRVNYFLQNPDVTQAIARRGCEVYWRNYQPKTNVKRVLDYIDRREIESIYRVEMDKRSLVLNF
ncbi:MAG: glycosyltransferase [Cyanobacteriota bacterium]|nr:glycosyltransferase [Cyanobacteriota bacterium]